MKKRNTVFIVELILLFLLLLLVITVITGTFMRSRGVSVRAGYLTDAVILAENVSETVLSADDRADAVRRLSAMDGVSAVTEKEGTVVVSAALGKPDAADLYRIYVNMQETDGYLDTETRVFLREEEEPLYTLSAGVYKGWES